MQGHVFRLTGTPTGSAFIVFTISAMATFSITGMNGLPSVLRTDTIPALLFRAPDDALCNAHPATAWFVGDDLRLVEVCSHNPERMLRASPSCVRDRFCLTVGACQDSGIRWPSSTETQRGCTITVPCARLDTWLGLFRGPLPMRHRMHQPTARQAVDQRPALAPVLSLAFVVAEPGFVFSYTTTMPHFGTGSQAELAQERASLHAHAWRLSGAKSPQPRGAPLWSCRPLVAPSLQRKAVRLPRQARQELLNGRRRALSS